MEKKKFSVLAGAIAALGFSGAARAAITVDGLLGSDYGAPLATQTVNTQFGDNVNTDGNTASGSELDAVYGVVQAGTGVLNLFFAGNAETNYNNLDIFIADGRSGQNVLNAQGAISSMTGSKFSTGFNATYAIQINGGGPGANPPTWYANTNDLRQSTGPSTYIGSYTPPSTTAQHDTGEFVNSGVHSGVFFGVDNSNILGVTGGTTAADPVAADAVTTGLEISIPLSVLGNPHGPIEVLAAINGNGNNYLSNQFLPGLPAGTTNPGATTAGKFDFSATPNEFFTVTVPAGTNTNGVWKNAPGGGWNTPGNWVDNAIPNFPGDSATFATATSQVIVTLDGNKTVGQISFGNAGTGGGYTIAQTSSTDVLTIDDTGDSGGVDPVIDVSAGNHTISAPVSMPATVMLSVTDGTSLTLSGAVHGAGGLTKTGAGTVFLSNTSNDFMGPLTILAGSVELDTAAAASNSTISIGDALADVTPATLLIGASGMTINNPIITNRDGSGSDSQRRIIANYFSGNSTVSSAITLDGGLYVAAPTGAMLTISGLISDGSDGSGTARHNVLANIGGEGGTVFLPNANSYSGITAVDAGTLLLGNNTSAGAGTIFIGNGGTILANTSAALLVNAAGINIGNLITTNKSDDGNEVALGTRTIGGTNSTGTVTFSGGIAMNGGAVLTAAAGGTVSFTGVIADGGDTGNVSHSLTVAGPGAIVLTMPNTYSGNTAVTGGALTVAATGSLPSTTNLTVSGASTSATFAAADGSGGRAETMASLSINTGGTVVLQSPINHADRTVYTLGGVTIAQVTPASGTTPAVWDGKLDAGGNDLILQAGPNTSLATVTAQIASGRGNGTWNGTSGITSSAAGGDGRHLTSLGVLLNDNQDMMNGPAAIYTSFGPGSGQPTNLDDVLVKYTYYGDANLDGQVSGADYQQIDNGYGMHLTGWQNGDFNYDGVVNGTDYSLIDNTANQIAATGAQPLAIFAQAATSAVPEPATLGLLGVGLAATLGRRRRTARGEINTGV